MTILPYGVRNLFYSAAPRTDLRGRLMWLAMLPVLLFALVWGGYVIQQRAQDLQFQAQQRAQLLARQLAIAADYGIFSFNQAALESLVQGVLQEVSVVSATIVSPDGRILATRYTQTHTRALLPQELRSMLAEIAINHLESATLENSQWIAHLEPVRSPLLSLEDMPSASMVSPNQDGLQGYAIVQVSTRNIQTQLFQFAIRVAILLVGVLIVTWFMARRISQNIHHRIQAVIQAAQKIGAGHSGIRVPLSTMPSFALLSQNINHMAEQLEQSHQRLEQRVQQATLALRQQRDAAQQANQDKTQFLASASHDLRQPMHALSMLIEAMKNEGNAQERAQLLQRIEASSQAMSTLLDALLDISRLDAGSVPLAPLGIELQPLLSRLREIYQTQAENRGIMLVIRNSPAQVHTDPLLLERILGNYLSNALRYTSKGGCVLLAVRRRGATCVIQVRDNGPGISPKDQRTIFKEFVQLHNPHRDRSQGLGLGLAIVQRLAHLLKHPIGVRSCLGHGTTFHVEVPLTQNAVAFSAALPEAFPSMQSFPDTGGLQGCRLLLVEDDELIRDSYGRLFRLWGCDTQVHTSADSVFTSMLNRDWRPQLIVTDHRLSGDLNGLQLIESLRQRGVVRCPAVIITGDTEDKTLAMSASQQTRILFKPVKPAELRLCLIQLWNSQNH